MGFFSNIKHAFNEGREKAHTENQARRNQTNLPKVIQLGQPNYGRIVTLQVISDAEQKILDMCIGLILQCAETLKAKATVSGKKVILECPDTDTAEIIRNYYK